MLFSSHISMDIGSKIKEIRTKHDLSQHRFGQKIGVSGKTVSAYETGRCIPPLKVLEEITDIYDAPFFQAKSTHKVLLKKRLDEVRKSLDELAQILV